MDDRPTQRLDPDALPEEEVATPPVRRTSRRQRRPVLSTAQCAKCGSRDEPIKVELVAERMLTARRIDVLFGLFGGTSSVRAQTCPNCGHIELYVSDLNRLLS
jgi:hypothetical protein